MRTTATSLPGTRAQLAGSMATASRTMANVSGSGSPGRSTSRSMFEPGGAADELGEGIVGHPSRGSPVDRDG